MKKADKSLIVKKKRKKSVVPNKDDAQLSEKKPDYAVLGSCGIEPEIYKKLMGTGNEFVAQDILLRTHATQNVPNRSVEKVVISAMLEMKPETVFEGMLCSQLLSLHCFGMDYLKRAENSGILQQRDSNLNNAIKLLRLQHETLECLMKLRRNGEQRVVVQHITVENGGKAIVGGVFDGGGGQQKSGEVPHGSTDM